MDPNAVVRRHFTVGGTRFSNRITLKDVAAVPLRKAPLWR
jgi:hypothetical protein